MQDTTDSTTTAPAFFTVMRVAAWAALALCVLAIGYAGAQAIINWNAISV